MVSSRLHWVLVLSLMAASCETRDETGTSRFGEAESKLRVPAPDPRAPRFDPPEHSCVNSIYKRASVRLTASLVPDEYQRESAPRNVAWSPGRLVDLAVMPNAMAVLDAMNGIIHLISNDLRPRGSWGSKGSGSGEFQDPSTLAVDSSTGDLWIFDAAAGRITVFDSTGSVRKTFPISHPTLEDIAVVNSRVYTSHFLMAELARSGGDFTVLMGIMSKPDATTSPLVRVNPDSIRDDQFVLPGPNHSRIVARGTTVAQFFPAAGIIDIYSDNVRTGTARVCMPRRVRSAYARQLKYVREGGPKSQMSLTMIGDVMIGPDGIVYAVSPLRDKAGRLHVDRFGLDGRDLGSIVAAPDSLNLPADLRFGRQPFELLAVGSHGTLIQLALVLE